MLGPCSDLRRLADGQYHPQLIQVLVGIAAVDEDPTSVAWANCGGSVGLVLDGLQETSMAHGFEFQWVPEARSALKIVAFFRNLLRWSFQVLH